MPDDTDITRDAENPEDIPDQDRLTVEADTEVPPAVLVRRGWVASTFESFTHRDFTLFWSGALVSNIGTWMQNAALAIVVYAFQPARASFNTGIVMGVSGLPVLFLAIPAGAIADRVDRRKLLIWIQVVLLIQAAALGILYDTKVLSAARPFFSLALVTLLGLVAGAFAAFQAPAFQSLLPDLVPRKSLMNAIALNSAQFQSSRMLGPLVVSAMVLAGAEMGLVFYINALSFLFVIAALVAIRPRAAFDAGHHAPQAASSPGSSPGGPPPESPGAWKTLMAGIAYTREDRVVRTLIISTALLTILGFPYMTILTAIIHAQFGGTPTHVARTYSIIYAFNGLGALVGALVVAGLPPTVPRNRIIPISLLAFATFVSAFSLARSVPLMCVFSVLAGAALMATNSLALTSIQASVPGYLRGRVMALFIMAFIGIMPVSALVFGPLGQAIGPDMAVLIAGLALMAWALLLTMRPAWLLPANASAPPTASA
jgi:MFS family permease